MSAAAGDLEGLRISVRRALVMGTAREPVTVPAWLASEDPRQGLLRLVGALGLRARFDRPAAPPGLERSRADHDPERLLGSRARGLLRQLYGHGKQPEPLAVALRVLDTLAASGLHVHPFDYSALAALLGADPTVLDPQALRWTANQAGDDDLPAVEMIDDETWADHPPAVRVQYLGALRATDPDRARVLCEASLAGEAATLRRRLLATFAIGIGTADVTYLEGFAKDRAPKVRQLAASLLARIPDTPAFHERLAQAHEHLEVKGGGLIGRKRMVRPKTPKGAPASWIDDTFADVHPVELASRLKLKPQQLAEALRDGDLRSVFFGNALSAGALDFATHLVSGMPPREAGWLASSHHERLEAVPPEQRAQLWRVFAAPLRAGELAQAAELMDTLYGHLRRPPPADMIAGLVDGRPWKRWVREATQEPDAAAARVALQLLAFAAPEQRAPWRARMQELSPGVTSGAFALADLFDAIDTQAEGAR